MIEPGFSLSRRRQQRPAPARLPYLPLLLGAGAIVIVAIAAYWGMVGFSG